jgi:hypothetical protein
MIARMRLEVVPVAALVCWCGSSRRRECAFLSADILRVGNAIRVANNSCAWRDGCADSRMEPCLGRKTTTGARSFTNTVHVERRIHRDIMTRMSTSPMTMSLIATGAASQEYNYDR